MKKKLLAIGILVMSICMLSISSFAQDAPGDAGETLLSQSQAIHFTRNNGDGFLLKAQIKMYYTTAPTCAPILTEIYYQGLPLFANFAPVTGDISNFATTGYVTFNIPTANIPPAIKLTLTYRTSATQPLCTISGTD